MAVGHIGHLVQIPRTRPTPRRPSAGLLDRVQSRKGEGGGRRRPEARPRAANPRPHRAEGDRFYRGHEGGFPAERHRRRRRRDRSRSRARVSPASPLPVPALRPWDRQGEADAESRDACAAPPRRWRKPARRASKSTRPAQRRRQILPMLAEAGATQVEPGHGLTGTTPLHAVEDLPEIPAVVYLSEVSHLIGERGLLLRRRPLYRSCLSRISSQGDRLARADRGGGRLRARRNSRARRDRLLRHDRRDRPRRSRESATASCSAFVRRLSSPAPMSSASPASRAARHASRPSHDAFGRPADWPCKGVMSAAAETPSRRSSPCSTSTRPSAGSSRSRSSTSISRRGEDRRARRRQRRRQIDADQDHRRRPPADPRAHPGRRRGSRHRATPATPRRSASRSSTRTSRWPTVSPST